MSGNNLIKVISQWLYKSIEKEKLS